MPLFQKMKQQKLLSFALLLTTLAVAFVIGTAATKGVKADRQVSSIAPDASPLNIPKADPIANEFTKLTKKVEPSVVYIESDYLPKPGKRGFRPKDDSEDEDNGGAADQKDPSDIFKHFFGGPQQRSFRTEGSGTGFVVDRNGYIITNHHVIENADRIKVRLAGDDTDYRARVIGFDQETDVAVLKIDARQALVPVQIGNSDSVQVGDWVIAIGSPFGLQATVTAGIISAERTSRDLPGANQFQNFLQTDAAINPGNSGGPLLNTRGEVIGVNTMIATRSGSYEGIGFALPSNMAVKVYNDIIREGRVIRGSIGIRFPAGGNQADMMEAFGLNHGVLVEIVAQNGPAGKAGMKPDDIIISMNDRPVKDGEELVTRVADMPVGSVADFRVDRNGKKLDFKVPIEERSVVWKDELQSSEDRPAEPETATVKPTGSARFGITIMRLTEKERKDLKIADSAGVKVVAIDPGSFAEDIGMREGDTILSINRQTVESPDEVMKVQASFKPGQAVAVHVVRTAEVGGDRAQPQRYYLSGRLPQP
jgi:serine protease Do